MICIVIKGPTFEIAHKQIEEAIQYAHVVELRLDYFEKLDFAALNRLRHAFSIPIIFTLRSQSQGGHFLQSESDRLEMIRQLTTLKPEYLDLEHHVPLSFIKEITHQYPDIKIILSYHNFEETPEDLEALYRDMQKIPAFFYKIAVTAQQAIDTLRLLCWVKTLQGKVIAISMGSHGQISRILGPIVESPLTYASIDDHQTTATGQLSAKTLVERYHYPSLHKHTAIYGLIGDPVDQSISDLTHNALMHACGLNAVYIKIQVRLSELEEFLQYAKELPFRGLSVTMPLKEHVLSSLDHIDPQAQDIGAVNTLLFKEGKIFGFNTDGVGALNAIEKKFCVKGKKIVIIGAGGAARAIIYEAVRRGATVTIVNRDVEKAHQVARHFRCEARGLESIAHQCEERYDVLINCTSVAMPIASSCILPETYVMDIKTKAIHTEFLKDALEKRCQIIYGYQMFIEQAVKQFALWFNRQICPSKSKQFLEDTSLKINF